MSFVIVSGVINGLVAKTELTDISIVRRLYTHGSAHCTIGYSNTSNCSYSDLTKLGAQMLNAEALLQWKSNEDSLTTDCFRGYVRSVRVERIEQRAYFHLEFITYSAHLDQIRNFRAWEDCTLKDICQYLITQNQGELEFGAGGASATGSVHIPLSVQYEETDFAYLSRMLHAWGIPFAVDDLNRKTLIGKPSVTSKDMIPDADDAHWNALSLNAGLVPLQTSAVGSGTEAAGAARGKIQEFNQTLKRTPGHLYEPKADAEHHANYLKAQKLEDQTNFDVNSVVCHARWIDGVFDVSPGALADFAGQQWLVREVAIQGHGSEVAAQEFTLLDKLMPLVPRYRRTDWPTQCLWAHVTKNNSEDPTKSGRIQVEFDWEQLEKTPFTRKCWLQTVTPYGGLKGSKESGGVSGFLSLPEEGEHVLVQFLDGWDSDAVVIGSVREHAAQGFAYAPHDTKRWHTPSNNQISMTTKDKGATDIVELMCKGKLIFRGEIKSGKQTVVMDMMSSTGDRIHFEKGSGPAQLDIFCSGNIYMHADNQLMLEAGTIQIKATKGPVKIDGTPLVLLNCGPTSMTPLHLALTAGAGGGGQAKKNESKGKIGGMAVVKLPNGDIKVGKAMTIHGPRAFQAKALLRLRKIYSTRSGRHTLDEIDKSGRTMDVVEFTGPNSYCGANDKRAQAPLGTTVFDGQGRVINDANGQPLIGTGTGSNTTLSLNPSFTIPNALDPKHPVPNDAVMFHELTHGAHQMKGVSVSSPLPGWTTLEEKTTILSGKPSEADYLREIGYPYHRVDHDTTFASNTPLTK